MDVIKTEANWHPRLKANSKLIHLYVVIYVLVIRGSLPDMQIRRHWHISLNVWLWKNPPLFINWLPSPVWVFQQQISWLPCPHPQSGGQWKGVLGGMCAIARSFSLKSNKGPVLIQLDISKDQSYWAFTFKVILKRRVFFVIYFLSSPHQQLLPPPLIFHEQKLQKIISKTCFYLHLSQNTINF